jgi:hypothetical protein
MPYANGHLDGEKTLCRDSGCSAGQQPGALHGSPSQAARCPACGANVNPESKPSILDVVGSGLFADQLIEVDLLKPFSQLLRRLITNRI